MTEEFVFPLTINVQNTLWHDHPDGSEALMAKASEKSEPGDPNVIGRQETIYVCTGCDARVRVVVVIS